MSGGTTTPEDGSAPQSASNAPRGSSTEPWTVRRLLAWTTPYLRDRGVDSPRTIAEILLAQVLEVERLRLYMEPDRELAAHELETLRGLVSRAGRHEPVQFLVGRWPFFGRDFEVAPCTLIPRPATEALVERALEWYRGRGGGDASVVDLCTGSGCVAVSLLLGMRAIGRPDGAGCRPIRGQPSAAAQDAADDRDERSELPELDLEGEVRAVADLAAVSADPSGDPSEVAPDPGEMRAARAGSLRFVATDIVADAVELARRNAGRLGAGAIEFRVGDLWSALDPADRESASFDAVVANPPYVTDDEYAALDRNVRDYEPASALRGGSDGLDFVRRIVSEAAARVRPGGLLALEVGWRHGEPVSAILAGGPWAEIRVDTDHEGIDRVVSAIRIDR